MNSTRRRIGAIIGDCYWLIVALAGAGMFLNGTASADQPAGQGTQNHAPATGDGGPVAETGDFVDPCWNCQPCYSWKVWAVLFLNRSRAQPATAGLRFP